MSAPPVPPRRSSVSITNPPVPPRRNSFGKAMLLALIALIPITIASRGSKDPAYTVGFFGAVPILAGFAVGIWAKVAKSRWSWFAYIWRFLAGTFCLRARAHGQRDRVQCRAHHRIRKTPSRGRRACREPPRLWIRSTAPDRGISVRRGAAADGKRGFHTAGHRCHHVCLGAPGAGAGRSGHPHGNEGRRRK